MPLIGLCFAGPLGAGAGAAIGVIAQPVMERWFAKCVDEFRGRGAVLAEAASRSSGLDQDEAVERLLASVGLQPLVARVLDAASRTNSTETLRLLGGTWRVSGGSLEENRRRSDAGGRHPRPGAWAPEASRNIRATSQCIQSRRQLGRGIHGGRHGEQAFARGSPGCARRAGWAGSCSAGFGLQRWWLCDH